jgi:hypothetical protein
LREWFPFAHNKLLGIFLIQGSLLRLWHNFSLECKMGLPIAFEGLCFNSYLASKECAPERQCGHGMMRFSEMEKE